MKRKIEPGVLCFLYTPDSIRRKTGESGGEKSSVCTALEYVGRYDGIAPNGRCYFIENAWRIDMREEGHAICDGKNLWPIPPDATDDSAEDAAPVEREVMA